MLSLLFAAALAAAPAPASIDCHVGAYRLDDGSTLDIAPTKGGVRWRRVDGLTGVLTPAADGTWAATAGWGQRADPHAVVLASCDSGRLAFDGMPGQSIALQVRETTFVSDDGTRLAGRLLLPEGDVAVPVVVLIHGSEQESAVAGEAMQRQLPAEGVGAFVYDKRGTGGSAGTYTQDFSVLANDAVAAVREARRLAGARASRVGVRGGSQGGWVAPLAATRTPVDFVIVGYGLAVSPLQQDSEAVQLQMRSKGYGPDVIAQAMEVVEAGHVALKSDGRDGIPAFDAVREKYRQAPWYKDVHGNVTHVLLPHMGEDLLKLAQAHPYKTPWDYDPLPVLRKLKTPQLWQLAESDLDAPIAETLRRLHALAADGAPITTAVFPGAKHGMTLFETMPDGSRVSTRSPAGYLRMILDFARGTLHPPYGDARIQMSESERAARQRTTGLDRRSAVIAKTARTAQQ
jgi:acetyl esterase/lipase